MGEESTTRSNVHPVDSKSRALLDLPLVHHAGSYSASICKSYAIWLMVLLEFIGLGVMSIALQLLVKLASGTQINFEDGLTPRQAWLTCALGYGIGLTMMVAYFLWEDGPCHWHQNYECAYLGACFFLIIITSALLSSQDQGHAAGFKSIVDAIVCFRILDQMCVMEMHSKFHDCAGNRVAFKGLNPAGGHFRVRRVVRDLDVVLKDIFKRAHGSHLLSTSDTKLPWAVFVLSTTVVAIEHLPESSFVLVAGCVAAGVNLLSLLSYAASVWKRHAIVRETAKVSKIVDGIVERNDEYELEYVLTNVSMGSLVEVVSWRTICRLTTEALERGMLTVLSKAILLDALQKARMRSFRRQNVVRQLLMSCSGADMTLVKNLVDGSGTYNNFYKLIYHDITYKTIRVDVLRHLATESRALRRELGTSNGIKVLSDVDDTLYSSGGKFPAGCDLGYPAHVVYPGFLPLLQVLDQERTACASSCNLVFLSARPHVYKDVAEDHSYQMFRNLVQMGSMHTIPTLLPGKLSQGLRAMACFACMKTAAWRPVGEQKLSTFVQYQRLYSEYDFIFCGDNGQGDLLAGQLMLRGSWRDQNEESRVLAVLIHQVLPDVDSLALEAVSQRSAAWQENWHQQGLFFHQGYVGVAVALHAQHPELISVAQLATIANRAVEEFDEARLMYDGCGEDFSAAEANLRRDLGRADDVVRGAGLLGLKCISNLEELSESSPCESLQSNAQTVELPLRKSTSSLD